MEILVVMLILGVFWSAGLAYALTCVLGVGLGDLTGESVAEALRLAGLFAISLRPQEPRLS